VKQRKPALVARLFRPALGLLRRFEVNRAVFFGVLTQGWSALAGPMTMVVIAHWLTPVQQGFYYTFSNVLALQVFVELGLATVIVQVASHEWAFLDRDARGRIRGDVHALSRLASLLRLSLKWYVGNSLVIMFVLSVGGYCFFSAKPHPGIAWQWPWLTLCVVAGLAVMLTPLYATIEGSNQVGSIYGYRLVQGIVNSIMVIGGISAGLGLYTLAVAASGRLLLGVAFIAWKHRNFIRNLWSCPIVERIRWRAEVLPFQWRIALTMVSSYFVFSIPTPVMFYYHGARVAGQMGMTWAMVAAIEYVALAWVSARMPQLGGLIARGQFGELDRLFRKLFCISLLIGGACSLALITALCLLKAFHFSIAERMLPLLPTVLLVGQRMLNLTAGIMVLFLRAHKSEPTMIPQVVSAVLVGASTFMLGARYGPVGVISGFLGVSIFWGWPSIYYVFKRYRAFWHQPAAGISDRGPVGVVA
jgi:O-antigen/teichoic acid export membrane protein